MKAMHGLMFREIEKEEDKLAEISIPVKSVHISMGGETMSGKISCFLINFSFFHLHILLFF